MCSSDLFFPLDTAPAQVHSDEFEAAVADQVKVCGIAGEMDIDAEAVGNGQFRQWNCSDSRNDRYAQEKEESTYYAVQGHRLWSHHSLPAFRDLVVPVVSVHIANGMNYACQDG